MPLTITEALAELKTLAKRLQAKRQYVVDHLIRPEIVKDPLEKDGGTPVVLAREAQAIADLAQRVITIRTSIQKANHITPVTVNGETRTLAEWLTWRKEVAPGHQSFLNAIRTGIQQNRKAWAARTDTNGAGLLVNWDEAALAADIEKTEKILGELDGQLSLKNATVMVEIG